MSRGAGLSVLLLRFLGFFCRFDGSAGFVSCLRALFSSLFRCVFTVFFSCMRFFWGEFFWAFDCTEGGVVGQKEFARDALKACPELNNKYLLFASKSRTIKIARTREKAPAVLCLGDFGRAWIKSTIQTKTNKFRSKKAEQKRRNQYD